MALNNFTKWAAETAANQPVIITRAEALTRAMISGPMTRADLDAILQYPGVICNSTIMLYSMRLHYKCEVCAVSHVKPAAQDVSHVKQVKQCENCMFIRNFHVLFGAAP